MIVFNNKYYYNRRMRLFSNKKAFIFSFLFSIFSLRSFSQGRPIVTDISAKMVSSARVEISWVLPKQEMDVDLKIQSLLVFKSTEPFASVTQIDSMEPLVSLPADTTRYTDILKNFREVYYAVIAETKTGRYDIILPSINATVKGIKAKKTVEATQKEPAKEEKIYAPGQKRELPLPFLEYLKDQKKEPTQFCDEAMEKTADLKKGYEEKKVEPLEMHIFDEDLISAAGGDEYILFEILKKDFVKGNFRTAAAALERFLAVNRNEKIVCRAEFYLGECNYFIGNFGKAVNCFLLIESAYPVLTRKWIESSLELYKIK